MKIKLLALVTTWGVISSLTFAQGLSDTERFNLAMELIKTACVSGERVSIQGEASGGLNIFDFKQGAGGSVNFSKDEIRGVVNSFNEAIRKEENNQIRSCMQPYVQQILSILSVPPRTEGPDRTEIPDISVLPKDQWLPEQTPLAILDKRVTVTITNTWECSVRKTCARVKVIVPNSSSPFSKNLKNAESMKFSYKGVTFRLTVADIQIDDQKGAKITIIQL